MKSTFKFSFWIDENTFRWLSIKSPFIDKAHKAIVVNCIKYYQSFNMNILKTLSLVLHNWLITGCAYALDLVKFTVYGKM